MILVIREVFIGRMLEGAEERGRMVRFTKELINFQKRTLSHTIHI